MIDFRLKGNAKKRIAGPLGFPSPNLGINLLIHVVN
jgi:hypothetical protein